MNKTNLVYEAEQRMINKEEPSDQDWILFQELYKKRPFISRTKHKLYKYLERHLYDHDYTVFTETERNNFRWLLRSEEISRNRLYRSVTISIIILAVALIRYFM